MAQQVLHRASLATAGRSAHLKQIRDDRSHISIDPRPRAD